MVPELMRAGPRNYGHEPGDEIFWSQHHRVDAVLPRPGEDEAHSSVAGPLQAIVREGEEDSLPLSQTVSVDVSKLRRRSGS